MPRVLVMLLPTAAAPIAAVLTCCALLVVVVVVALNNTAAAAGAATVIVVCRVNRVLLLAGVSIFLVTVSVTCGAVGRCHGGGGRGLRRGGGGGLGRVCRRGRREGVADGRWEDVLVLLAALPLLLCAVALAVGAEDLDEFCNGRKPTNASSCSRKKKERFFRPLLRCFARSAQRYFPLAKARWLAAELHRVHSIRRGYPRKLAPFGRRERGAEGP